jgi:hypothetical protein
MITRLREQLAVLPRLKELVTVARGSERLDERNPKVVFTKATLPRGERVGKRYARFAPTASVGRHALAWQDTYVDPDLYSRERKAQFSRPKLVFADVLTQFRIAYDRSGLYLGRSLFSVGCRPMVNHAYLTGLLNSHLLNFAFNVSNPSGDGAKSRRLEPKQLHELPVFVPGDEFGRKLARFIEGNADCLVHVKQARHLIASVWSYLAGQHARRYAPFGQLLANTLPGQTEPWVRRLAPSLAQINRRSRRFPSIRFTGDRDGPTMRICGRTEAGDEAVLAEVEFADRELMLFASLSAGSRRPRSRATTIRGILEEELVPVPDDVTGGAHSMVRQLLDRTPRVLAAEGIPALRLDPVWLESETEQREAVVNAEVFRLYGLNWPQVEAVMRRLPLGNAERERIRTIFDRLDSATGEDSLEPTPELTSGCGPAGS